MELVSCDGEDTVVGNVEYEDVVVVEGGDETGFFEVEDADWRKASYITQLDAAAGHALNRQSEFYDKSKNPCWLSEL